MEIVLGIVSVCNLTTFAIQSAEFLTDEYEIYHQISRIKDVCKRIGHTSPRIVKIYQCDSFGKDGIIINEIDWSFIDK